MFRADVLPVVFDSAVKQDYSFKDNKVKKEVLTMLLGSHGEQSFAESVQLQAYSRYNGIYRFEMSYASYPCLATFGHRLTTRFSDYHHDQTRQLHRLAILQASLPVMVESCRVRERCLNDYGESR